MHWIEQDGLRLPKRLGGHPALDFCNTWAGWGEQSPVADGKRDWLFDYDQLAAWARYADLLDDDQAARVRRRAQRQRAAAEDVLADVRALRTDVHTAVLDPDDPKALRAITEHARRAAAVHHLVPGPDGTARWVADREAGLELPLLVAARAAAELLTSPAVRDVSACPGVDCGWLFIDARRRRRWCDMAVCGNRAKQAAHAERVRERRA